MSHISLSSTLSGISQRPSGGESISSMHPNPRSLDQQIARAFASGHTLDTPELMKAVMELQQENTDLRREIAELKTRIVDLKLQLKSDGKNSNSPASIEQEMKADIVRAARYFHVFMSPSVPAEAFKIDKPMFLHDSLERYDDGQEKYGIVAELHHSIPQKYLSYLRQHDSLVKEFLSSLSTGRSNALERFRSNASRVFDTPDLAGNSQLDQALFATGIKRSQNQRVRELLGITIDGGKTFSSLPPVLFSRENPHVMSRLFFHPSLFKLARLTVYGPSALGQKDPRKLIMRANNTYFHPVSKLAPTSTPGFISWICMMACYMLSDDTEFNSSGIGNITGMKYFENYEIYKQTLIEGLATGKTHFLDIFATWNSEVFPRSQVGEDISDSPLALHSGLGGNMGGNQRSNVNNVAKILKQLSFEENEGDEEEEKNTESNHHHSDSENNSENEWDDFYVPDLSLARSMIPAAPDGISLPIRSDVLANAIAKPTNARNSPLPTVNTHLMDDIQYDKQSGSSLEKASESAAPKKTLAPSQTTRRSSRTMKMKATNDSNTPPIPTPIQPIDTAPPKPKRAPRGNTKGKTRG